MSFGCIFSRGCFWDKVPALICFSFKLEDLLIQRLVLRVITVTVAIGLRGSTLFRWAGASRRGAVSFRKVVPCRCHARIDPTPVLGFMSVAAEQLGIRDWTKQTSVRLLQWDTSYLTLDISGFCLHLNSQSERTLQSVERNWGFRSLICPKYLRHIPQAENSCSTVMLVPLMTKTMLVTKAKYTQLHNIHLHVCIWLGES